MSVLENPTAYSGHRTHTAPSSGPIRHHYLLNFAVSIAAVLFGIAIIAAFALAVRWRKRTTQSYLLEPRLDARIPQSSISDVSDGRSTISLKFLPPGLPPPQNTRNRLLFLPRTPPHAHHPAPHARPSRTCQSCISGLNNRPPCYCPTCPNGPSWDNPPAYRANASPTDVIPSPRLSTTLVGRDDVSPPRPGSTDENTIRRNSQRTPPAQVVGRNGHDRSVEDSPTPAGHLRGSGTVAEDNAVSYSSESSTSTLSPCSASSTAASPRLGPPIVRPPPLHLSDGTAASTGSRGRELAVIPRRGALGLAASRGQSDGTYVHIRVAPPCQDLLDAPSYDTHNDERAAAASPPSESGLRPAGVSSSIAAVEGRDTLATGSRSR